MDALESKLDYHIYSYSPTFKLWNVETKCAGNTIFSSVKANSSNRTVKSAHIYEE